jgi:PAP2 superfamily
MDRVEHREAPRTADPAPAEGWRDYRWLIAVWILVAGFAAVALVRSHQIGIPIRDPGGSLFRWRIVYSIALLAVFIVVQAGRRVGRGDRFWERVREEVRSRWPRQRVALAVTGLVAYYVVYACYHNLKSWNAFNTQHDDALLRVDSWLFFGHDPAVLLHDLLGQHLAAFAFAVIYESFGYLVPLAVVGAVVCTDRIRDGYVFLAASMWAWVLGTAAYYLIPAIGPFYADPQAFAQLSHTVVTTNQAEYLAERAYFLQHPHASNAFSSIGAFASLHTGFTCMVLLMAHYYGWRRATKAVFGYLVATLIATIYLGWHFVVDDIAGVVLAIVAVSLGRLMIYPGGRRPSARGWGSRHETAAPAVQA